MLQITWKKKKLSGWFWQVTFLWLVYFFISCGTSMSNMTKCSAYVSMLFPKTSSVLHVLHQPVFTSWTKVSKHQTITSMNYDKFPSNDQSFKAGYLNKVYYLHVDCSLRQWLDLQIWLLQRGAHYCFHQTKIFDIFLTHLSLRGGVYRTFEISARELDAVNMITELFVQVCLEKMSRLSLAHSLIIGGIHFVES